MVVARLLVLAVLLAPAAVAQTSPGAAKAAAKKPSKAEEEAAARAAEDEARARAEADARAAAEATASAAAAAASTKAAADAEAEARAQESAAKAKALQAQGLDARMRALAGLMALQLKRLPGDHREQNFAVVPFENVGEETVERSLGLVVSDLLTTDLARDHRLPLVERSQLNRVMGELALQQSGAIDDKQAVELGKLSGARALVVGRVSDVGTEFIVAARAVDAESGSVLAAEEVKLPKAELVAFSTKAVVLRSRSGAAFRSVVLPGWGQAYNDEPVKGAIVGGAFGGLVLATAALGGHALYGALVEYPKAGRVGPSAKLPTDEKLAYVESVRVRTNTEAYAAQIVGGAAVGVWLLNIADAYLSGTDVDSLDKALARN
jgi:TolB-like protein